MDAEKPSSWWEHFPHDADMGIRGIGHSKAEAFEQAALALTAVTLDPDKIHPHLKRSFSCESPDGRTTFQFQQEWQHCSVQAA